MLQKLLEALMNPANAASWLAGLPDSTGILGSILTRDGLCIFSLKLELIAGSLRNSNMQTDKPNLGGIFIGSLEEPTILCEDQTY